MRKIEVKPIGHIIDTIPESNACYILCSTDPLIISGKDAKEYSNVINVVFKDIPYYAPPDSFTTEQAEQIKDFLERIDPAVQLFVCCDFGISRSPAVAAAIILKDSGYDEQKENWADEEIWGNPHFEPNSWVFQVLCKVLGVKITTQGITKREAFNARAIKDHARRLRDNSSYKDSSK